MQLAHRPSEAMPQLWCWRCRAAAPNALAAGRPAQGRWRWAPRPPRRCISQLRALRRIDACSRACPLTVLPRGHDAHELAWLQRGAAQRLPACGVGALAELCQMAMVSLRRHQRPRAHHALHVLSWGPSGHEGDVRHGARRAVRAGRMLSGWCTMHQHRGRRTCRQHREPGMGCCCARCCRCVAEHGRSPRLC